MRRYGVSGALALASTAKLQAMGDLSPRITGDRVYANVNASDATEPLSHQNYQLNSTNSCGFLIKDAAVLSLLDSNISKPVYSGEAKLTSIYGSAAVCVVNHSTFNFDHGSISTFGDNQVGVWAQGQNTTIHLTDITVENNNSDSAFGLVAEQEAVLLAELVAYSSDPSSSTCAFVADGGKLTVHESVAHVRGGDSHVFCSIGGGEAAGQIHSQGVIGISEKGPAVMLSGNTQLAALTDTTLFADGPAVVSTKLGSGAPGDTVLRVTSSSLTATNPLHPLLLFTLKDMDAILHRTELTPSPSNILLHAACTADLSEGACAPFRATVLVSESTIAGDIRAWDPAYLAWKLSSNATWTGAVASNTTTSGTYGSSPVDVRFDNTSAWNVTADSWVQALASARGDLSNVFAAESGVVVHYNASHVLNAYLEGKSVELQGGGSAQPY